MDNHETRKPIRLADYDYASEGYYFVTICVKDMQELLGKVVDVDDARKIDPLARPFVELTPIGQSVEETILVANKSNIKVDKYVIMPNHIHMIIVLDPSVDGYKRPSLQQVVRNIKSFTTKHAKVELWQSRFYDHVIRDEADYKRVWEYIDNNPAKWFEDEYFNWTGS